MSVATARVIAVRLGERSSPSSGSVAVHSQGAIADYSTGPWAAVLQEPERQATLGRGARLTGGSVLAGMVPESAKQRSAVIAAVPIGSRAARD